jgi:hypothetical protein
MTFPLPLVISPVRGSKRDWRLVEPFKYEDEDHAIFVPGGFVTDFASIPRGLWNIFPPWGKYGKAAIVHDYLYRTKGQTSKRTADLIFLRGMEVLEVPKWKRKVMYWAVKYFGHGSWVE